jgi:hypothetical protein
MTTLLISGSRAATEAMLVYARMCVEKAYQNGYMVIAGDAPGIDAAVAQVALDFYEQHLNNTQDGAKYGFCEIYGLDEKPRHGIVGRGVNYNRLTHIKHQIVTGTEKGQYVRIWNEAVTTYAARDRYMVELADKVICITTRYGTTGTMSVYKYAEKLGKECWLRRDK